MVPFVICKCACCGSLVLSPFFLSLSLCSLSRIALSLPRSAAHLGSYTRVRNQYTHALQSGHLDCADHQAMRRIREHNRDLT